MATTSEGIVFENLDAREVFSHCVLLGLGALCEAAGMDDLRLSWSAGMSAHPVLAADGLDETRLAAVVHEHARKHDAETSWIHLPQPGDPKRALLSPRIAALGDDRRTWRALHDARHAAEDALDTAGDLLSLALIGSLGEPAYWRSEQSQRLQDDGASRLEMQPRNQGSEFVGTRLRGLAAAVAGRSRTAVADGLLGRVVTDEMGKGAADSRTATNLRPLGPTDSALAWVALWGISQIPLAHRVGRRSATATHVRGAKDERGGRFVFPLWQREWRPAKVRAVLASHELAEAAEALAHDGAEGPQGQAVLAALRRAHGVGAVISFPVDTSTSTSAPERRALRGHPVALAP